MVIFEIFKIQNLIQIYTKMHQIAPFKKNSREGGGMPPNPLAMRVANFQI